ncbi:MAG: hypothetical protein Q4G66_04155 [bacterium]|nr:hypothetical protein [bacterium]
MQEIIVVLSLVIAFIYVARLLFKSFRGQASTCGCACQGCHLSSRPTDKKNILPMYRPDPDNSGGRPR